MAITRAQQAKQLLANGGRIGYRGGADMGAVGTEKDISGAIGSGSNEKISASDARDTNIDRAQKMYEARQIAKNLAEDKAQEPFETLIIKDSNFPGLIGMGLNALKGPRQKLLNRNVDFFRFDPRTAKAREKYGLTAQGYKNYMKDRLAGDIDAAGNPIMTRDDDDNVILPVDTTFNMAPSNMDQGTDTTEEDQGLRLAFRANGGRIGFGGGSDMGTVADSKGNVGPSKGGYQGGGTGPVERPSGGGGDNNNQPPQKINIPKPIKDAGNTAGELMFLKNVFELNPVGIMKNIGTKMFLDKLISDADTQQDQNMMLADVSAMDLKRKNQFKNLDYGTAMDIGIINPTMTQEEFEGVKSGEITKPTGQFARDGGRIGAMDGGIMNTDIVGGMMDGNIDLESARQMYGLGKLVKKVTRTVKKIAKSPIGKAALVAGGGYLLGGGTVFGKALPGIGTSGGFAFRNILPNLIGVKESGGVGVGFEGILGKLGLTKGFGSAMPTALAGILGASALAGLLTPEQEQEAQDLARGEGIDIEEARRSILNAGTAQDFRAVRFRAEGGSTEEKEPVAKKTMPLIDMGGKEKDYRETGGFVDIGRMEKADDVPARLSKNEFVFTADAVRNAGDGSVDKGAEVMYNMMKNLEAGGEVSEESQGLKGARKMFQTSQRLEEVL